MSSWNILPNISFLVYGKWKRLVKEFKFLGEASFFMNIALAILGFRTTLSVNISFIKHVLWLFKPHWWPYLILFQPFYLLRSACYNEHWSAACWTSKVQLGNWRAAPWYRYRILVSFLVQGLLLTGSRRDHRGRWLDLESTEPDAFLMGTIKPFACCL